MAERKFIPDEQLTCGHFFGHSNEKNLDIFLTIINIEPLSVMNVFDMDGNCVTGRLGDTDIYELTKEDRRKYFDMMVDKANVNKHPHYDGEHIIPCGSLICTKDGRLGGIISSDIPTDKSCACSTINHVNFETGEKTSESLDGDGIYDIHVHDAIEKRYWQIIYEWQKNKGTDTTNERK